MTEYIEEKQLKWYGHVKRMGMERIVRKSIEAKEWGKRTRGRPRVTWIDNIEKYGKERGKTLRELEKTTRDREKWKKLADSTRR